MKEIIHARDHEQGPAAVTGWTSCSGSYFGEKRPVYGAGIILEFMVDVCSVTCVSEDHFWLRIKGEIKVVSCQKNLANGLARKTQSNIIYRF